MLLENLFEHVKLEHLTKYLSMYYEFYYLLILSVSCAAFYFLGVLFFNRSFSIDNSSSTKEKDYRFQYMHTNKYHATSHTLSISRPTKVLFLTVFIVSCSLMELICLDILQVIKPDYVSHFIWKVHLFALCMIMNVLTPFVFMMELCLVRYNLSGYYSILVATIAIVIIQVIMWSTAGLPYFPIFNSDISILTWVKALAWSYFDISKSVTRIAIIGTALAAVVAATSSISFVLEELMIARYKRMYTSQQHGGTSSDSRSASTPTVYASSSSSSSHAAPSLAHLSPIPMHTNKHSEFGSMNGLRDGSDNPTSFFMEVEV